MCGSKHKSHFLSIHDIIANKSPQELGERLNDSLETESDSSKTDLQFIPPSITSPKDLENELILDNNCSKHSSDETELNSNEELYSLSQEL